ncbi:MAG: tRNA (guanosine(46)-N7)-methyltransferase TrmB [Bacilli bacterium]|nr:tRNA (guanosine(46)-N7)-methyltransferase TrmB [Bacilli bacterium]
MRLRNVKNKEEILLSSHFLVKDPYSYKGRWYEYFGNKNPIYIEIGMGKGKFLIECARNHPDINYIGIEKYDSVVAKALPKIPDDLNNICVIRADAHTIEEFFQSEINQIFLNFSDPWPKKRHHQRRLSSEDFLKRYDSIFKNEKVIEMRTDNRELFLYSLISFSNYGYVFESISLDFHKDYNPEETTEYEDKFSNLNYPIYFTRCIKK